MTKTLDLAFLREAIRLSIEKMEANEGGPFGAVVVRNGEIVPKDGKRFQFLYEYDFGDGWEHDVAVLGYEGTTRAPRCLDGAGACPPEDCGGVSGYEGLLEAVADPAAADAELLEWVGGSFDSERFDPKKVRLDDPLERWRRAFT